MPVVKLHPEYQEHHWLIQFLLPSSLPSIDNAAHQYDMFAEAFHGQEMLWKLNRPLLKYNSFFNCWNCSKSVFCHVYHAHKILIYFIFGLYETKDKFFYYMEFLLNNNDGSLCL